MKVVVSGGMLVEIVHGGSALSCETKRNKSHKKERKGRCERREKKEEKNKKERQKETIGIKK